MISELNSAEQEKKPDHLHEKREEKSKKVPFHTLEGGKIGTGSEMRHAGSRVRSIRSVTPSPAPAAPHSPEAACSHLSHILRPLRVQFGGNFTGRELGHK